MSSGAITITPGFSWTGTVAVNNANLAATANPTARLDAGAVTARELAIDLGSNAFTNRLINGNFDVWQRGTAAVNCTAGARTYRADRWYVTPVGATITQERSTSVPDDYSRYSLLLTGATSVATVDVAQRLTAQTVLTGGKLTMIFSCQVYNNSGASFTPTLIVRTPSAADTWTTNTARLTQVLGTCANAAWTQVSYSFDPSAYTDIDNGMEVCLQIPAGSLVAGDTVYLAQMDLRIGAAVGVYELLPYGLTLDLCRYYYEIPAIGSPASVLALCQCISTTQAMGRLHYRTKRIAPQISVTAASDWAVNVGASDVACSAVSGTQISTDFCNVFATVAAGLTANNAVIFKQAAAGNSTNLVIDAEL
jgi:hypothetical protein